MRHIIGLLSLVVPAIVAAGAAAATPLPQPCAIIAETWLDTSRKACDAKAVDAVLKASRNKQTQIDIKDLHQATYRNPVGAISDLAFKGFVGPKRDDVPPVPLILPVDWANADYDRNWRFNLNSWKMVEPMLAWHAKSGERLPLRMAMDLIADWTRFNIIDDTPNKLKWYDIATGQRAMKLAFLIDTIYRNRFKVSQQERALLLGVSYIHIKKLLDPDFINPGNHGTFQIHGLAALCRTLPMVDLCIGADPYIAEQMEQLVIGQYGQEAMHMEHSAEYHFFMYKVFERLFSTGWYDDLAVTRNLLERADRNKRWLIFPTGEVVRHGDTDQRAEPLPDPSTLRLQQDCRRPTGRITDCYILKTFPDTGYATVRSAWDAAVDQASMLFLMGSYHSHAHKQRDHMSIELFEQGMPILVDSGKFAYDPTNPRRDYVLSTRAHNTVEIDETDYTRNKRDAVGAILRSAEAFDWGYRIDAGMRHVTTDTRHDRTLAYRPGRWLLVIDRLKSEKTRRYEQWFHLHETLTADMQPDGYTVALPGGGRLRALVAATGSDCALRRVRGQQEPRLQGWISREYRSFMPNDAIGHACHGDTVSMATLFVLEQGDAAAITLSRESGDGDDWRVTDRRDALSVTLPPPPAPDAATTKPRGKSGKRSTSAAAAPQPSAARPAPDRQPSADPARPSAPMARSAARPSAEPVVKPAQTSARRYGTVAGRAIVGLAFPAGQGRYRASVQDMAVGTAGKERLTLDEVDLLFDAGPLTPAAFALVCDGDTPSTCSGRDVQGDGQGSRIGSADITGVIARYYQAGAFGSGMLAVRSAGTGLSLSGAFELTRGSDRAVTTVSMALSLQALPLSDGQVASLRAARRRQCDRLDPRPILDELGRDRYATTTFARIATAGADPDRISVLLRHDVDRSIDAMSDLAALQNDRGIPATYFINLAAGFAGTMSGNGHYVANDGLVPHLLRLQGAGHEVGYHTDAIFMDLFHDVKIDVWLKAELDRLRRAGLTIVTEASNGSPYRRVIDTHNRFAYADFRQGGRLQDIVRATHRRQPGFDGRIEAEVDGRRISRILPPVGLRDVGLEHAAYYPSTYGVDPKVYTYLTDSRLSANQIIAGLQAARPGDVVQVLLHPWRWALCEPGVLAASRTGGPD